jgi:hypothetical protein
MNSRSQVQVRLSPFPGLQVCVYAGVVAIVNDLFSGRILLRGGARSLSGQPVVRGFPHTIITKHPVF